jgi:hypothetical protein
MDYLYTDTLNQLVPKTDTLYLANKLTKEQREKLKKQDEEKKEKERKKREKKGEKQKEEQIPFLAMKVDAPSAFDVNRNILLAFDEPVARIDTSAIHLSVKEDTLWVETPFLFVTDSILPRQYEILAEWQPEKEYQLKIDLAAVVGLHRLRTNKPFLTFKVKKLDE